jgi:branched-chain amino acid transport system ATP-binding protein
MSAILAIENLSLRFGGIVALDGVSLAVEQGELMAVVGPNGAGKTSLLNCDHRRVSAEQRPHLP